MAALNDLVLAIDRLTSAVDRVVAGGGTGGGVPEADVAAQTSRILEQSQRLEALPPPNGGGTELSDAVTHHK